MRMIISYNSDEVALTVDSRRRYCHQPATATPRFYAIYRSWTDIS